MEPLINVLLSSNVAAGDRNLRPDVEGWGGGGGGDPPGLGPIGDRGGGGGGGGG